MPQGKSRVWRIYWVSKSKHKIQTLQRTYENIEDFLLTQSTVTVFGESGNGRTLCPIEDVESHMGSCESLGF